MSHYHLEIVMPPTDNVQAAVAKILEPFNENQEDSKHTFFDWWVLGGRFAGRKSMSRYDQANLDEFHAWLQSENVTVSGITAGKQEISPADQIPKIDAKWNEMFPREDGSQVACPLFKHSNDQYANEVGSLLDGDVARFSSDWNSLKSSRVIFSAPSYNAQSNERTGPLEAVFMVEDSYWNGVSWIDTAWDGTFGAAVKMHMERIGNMSDSFRKATAPKDDWLVVTVDYHN